ncbi:MAG: M24 family metallopeptidase [bacterium]
MAASPIAEQRIIKTPEEIEKLRESQKINKAVYEHIQPYLQIGVTEEAIARRIQILQLELGASGPSFPPIVAFGENTAIPHHSPTSRKLQKDDVILIDMGVIYQGYCSDMTRCIIPKY